MHLFHKNRKEQPKSSTSPPTNTFGPPVGGGVAHSSDHLTRSRSASPSPSTSPIIDSIQTVPAVSQPRDLWKVAFDSLDKCQRESLQNGASMNARDVNHTIDSVIKLTESEYKNYCIRGWHIEKGDKTKGTIMRIWAKEILCSAIRFKDIVDQGLKFDPSGYGTIVWAIVLGGLQLIQNDMDRVEAIFNSAAAMTRILTKYAVVEVQYRDWPIQEQTAFEDRVIAVYSALLLYVAEAKKGLDKSMTDKVLSSFRSVENQTITSLHADLMKKDEEATDMLHIVAHQQRKMEFSKIDEKTTQSLDQIDEAVKHLLETEKVRVLSWLSNSKPSDRQHSLRVHVERDNPDSGRWFLTLPEFSNWQQDPGSFLWLNGVSGCGKSTLCSTIINSLQSAAPSHKMILAYWYFDNGNAKTRDLLALLRFLLRQIAAVADVFPPPVRTLAEKHEKPGSDPEVRELCKVLHETISGLRQEVFIIIDAIDEYPANGALDRRSDLLTVISDLVKAQLEKLHILVTSIDERDINKSFHSLDKPPIELDVEPLLFEDVSSFVDATIERFASSKPWWTNDIRTKIRNALKANDYKRFRIVALGLEDLSHCFNEEELDVALNSIPPTVEDLYERRLGQVSQKNIPRLCHIFHWISLAGRQLSLTELAAAPGVNLRNPDDVLVICPRGMLRKEEKRNLETDTSSDTSRHTGEETHSAAILGEAPNEIVMFDHPSVKRFLFSQKLFNSNGITSEFFIAEEEVHLELAKFLLQYLLTIRQPRISAAFVQSQPFLLYAADYCVFHLRKIPNIDAVGSQATPVLLDLFESPMRPGFLNWMRVKTPLKARRRFHLKEADCPSPLYVAISLKLQTVADHLIANGSFVNSHGGKYLTALHLALTQNDYNLALKLVEAGADLTQRNDKGSSPLYLAVQGGAKELVQKMLTSGAKINSKDGTFDNALQLACYLGDSEIVRVLLAYKPDVNAEGGLFGTALQAASAIGHDAIVAMLLQERAQPDILSGLLGNAIQAAVTGGHSGVVDQLVANGAAFDTKGDGIWTEAFQIFEAEENWRDGKWHDKLNSFLAHRGKGSSGQCFSNLSKSQQLLAVALEVLQRQPLDAENLRDRAPRHRFNRTGSHDSKVRPVDVIACYRKSYEIGLESRDSGGFHCKALFQAAVSHLLPQILEIETSAPQIHGIIRAFEIVNSRRADQCVVENDKSGVYAAARVELTELYKLAFMLITMLRRLLGHKFLIVKGISEYSSRRINELLQSLTEKDQKLTSAMLLANISAASAQTANLEPRIMREIHSEMQRTKHEVNELVTVTLHDFEQQVLNSVRETLPGIIREEVQKAIGEHSSQSIAKESQWLFSRRKTVKEPQ